MHHQPDDAADEYVAVVFLSLHQRPHGVDVSRHHAIGVQLVIWDRTIWNASKSAPKDRLYTGVASHADHLHVELNAAGAARLTPWFAGPNRQAPISQISSGGFVTLGVLGSCLMRVALSSSVARSRSSSIRV